MTSAYNIEGYFDNYNFTSANLLQYDAYKSNRETACVKHGDKQRWEFAFSPNIGFLGNPEPLIRNCELKLSFDRAHPDNSTLRLAGAAEQSSPYELKDLIAITEYVSSPSLINYFDRLEHTPIKYEFDNCHVIGPDYF